MGGNVRNWKERIGEAAAWTIYTTAALLAGTAIIWGTINWYNHPTTDPCRNTPINQLDACRAGQHNP